MPRYVELRKEREWLVVDTKSMPFRVLCVCSGYDAPFNAQLIIEALEGHHNHLYSKFIGVSNDALSSA